MPALAPILNHCDTVDKIRLRLDLLIIIVAVCARLINNKGKNDYLYFSNGIFLKFYNIAIRYPLGLK